MQNNKPTYETQMSLAFREFVANIPPQLAVAKTVRGSLTANVGMRPWYGFPPHCWAKLQAT